MSGEAVNPAPEKTARDEVREAVQKLIAFRTGVPGWMRAIEDIIDDMIDTIRGNVEEDPDPGGESSDAGLTPKQVDDIFQSELQAYRERQAVQGAPENKKVVRRLQSAHEDLYHQLMWGKEAQATAWRNISQAPATDTRNVPTDAEATEEVGVGGRKRRTRRTRKRITRRRITRRSRVFRR